MNLALLALAAQLSFTDALTVVTAKSLDPQKQRESEATAQERLNASRYTYLPSVSASGKSQLQGFTPGGRDNTRAADLTLNANLYRFGGDQAKNDQASATAKQNAFATTAAVQDAEEAAALALLAVVEAGAELEVERGIRDAGRANVEMAKRLYSRGVRSAQDVDKVVIDAANDAARYADSDVRRARAQADLESIAGTPLAVAVTWPWTAQFRTGAAKLAAEKPDVARRADRQALAARVEALDAASVQARSGRLPSVDASFDYGYSDQQGPDVVPYKGRGWTGTLTFTAPLFDRLTAEADEAEQVHLRNAAALDVESKDRAVRADWEASREAFTTTVASAAQRDQTLEAARDLYQHSLKSFQSGLLGANELSLDETRLHDAELLAVQGWYAAHQSFVRLCRSLDRRLADCARLLD